MLVTDVHGMVTEMLERRSRMYAARLCSSICPMLLMFIRTPIFLVGYYGPFRDVAEFCCQVLGMIERSYQ